MHSLIRSGLQNHWIRSVISTIAEKKKKKKTQTTGYIICIHIYFPEDIFIRRVSVNHYQSPGKFSKRQINDIFLIFPRKQDFMQIVFIEQFA